MAIRDLVMLSALLVMVPMIFMRPHTGIILWAWTAMLVPNSFLFGIGQSVRFNLIFAVATLVAWFISKEPKKIPLNSTNVLLFFFLFWVCLSTLFGVAEFDARMHELTNLIKVIVFTVAISALVTSRLRVHSLLIGIALGMGYHGAAEGAKFIVSGGNHQVFGPSNSIIGDNNHFALAMIFLLPVIFYLYHYSSKRLIRLGFLGAGGLIFASVIGTFSRGGLVTLAAVGAFWLLRSKYKVPMFAAMCVGLAFVVYFAPDHWFERMTTIREADQDSSFMGRVVAWKISLLLALDHPILGGGITAIQNADVWEKYVRDFGRLDFIPTGPPDKVRAAHSVYFQLVADVGFVGLGIFLLILFRAWWSCSKLIKKTAGISDLEWINNLARALQVSFVAYCVAGAALNMAYFEMLYVFVVLVAVQENLTKQYLEKTTPQDVPLQSTLAAQKSALGSRAKLPAGLRRQRF